MCGFVGFFGFSNLTLKPEDVLRRMASVIHHRGPDDNGVWVDGEAEVGLAHRRLSIVDLSPAGHQPMTSADGRYVIAYNGEIFNHETVRSELDAQRCHPWRGHSDTEVLLAAITRWGLKGALDRCVGMFAFALWDRKERVVSLARDRLGEKPVYFGWLGKNLVFASEIKALSAHPDWDGTIDRQALALLMRHNYVPAPYSIYKEISKLRPGRILTCRINSCQPSIEAYWSARQAAEDGLSHPFRGTRTEAVDALEGLLRQSLSGQMVADVPLGAFLSGGINSSTVAAVMQSMSEQPVRTFTIGFDVPGYDEATHARKVADHLGTNHTELYVTERDAMDVIPKLPTIYCEPFSDSSQIPTYLVSKLARSQVTVSLSGDGGDELFSGYNRYGLANQIWGKLSRVPRGLRRAFANLAALPSPQAYDSVARPLMYLMPERRRYERVGDKVHKAAHLLSLQSVDDVYMRLCSHWNDPSSLVLDGNEPPTMLTGLEALPALSGPVQRMMYTDLVSYLPDDILVKVDRAAMAVSLETRVPLLDHRLVEFAMSLPLSIARADQIPKWPLRQLLYRYVPQELVDRPKMEFGIPIDSWLRNGLRDWAEDLLSESRLRNEGFFQPEPIRRAWEEHLSGRRNYQYLLWDVLMFQAWKQSELSTTGLAA